MRILYDRLGACERPPRADKWKRAVDILVAAAIGAALAAIPLFNSKSNWDKGIMPAYVGAIVIIGGIALLCHRASRDIADERGESIANIRRDLEGLIDSFELEERGDEPPALGS